MTRQTAAGWRRGAERWTGGKKKRKNQQWKNSLFSFPACWTADKRDQRRCSSASAMRRRCHARWSAEPRVMGLELAGEGETKKTAGFAGGGGG